MNLEFFLSSYDLNEMNFDRIYIKHNVLYLYVDMNVHLELIANGYRPEVDIDQHRLFVFKNVSVDDYQFEAPYVIEKLDYSHNVLAVLINGLKVKIPNQEIDIFVK